MPPYMQTAGVEGGPIEVSESGSAQHLATLARVKVLKVAVNNDALTDSFATVLGLGHGPQEIISKLTTPHSGHPRFRPLA